MSIETRQTAVPQRVEALPAWLSRGRIPCLDGLRGISIMLVLFSHAVGSHGFAVPARLRFLSSLGDIGVDIFFAISGFLITVLLLRELERTKTLSLKGFYLRRVLRIVPAYAAFVLVIYALSRAGALSLRPQEWGALLTYSMDFVSERHWVIGHIWSLSIEEQFYLIWPPVLLALGPTRARVAMLGCLVMGPAMRTVDWILFLAHHEHSNWMYTRVDAIAAGCLLALFAREPALLRRLTLPGHSLAWMVSLAVGLCVNAYAAHRYVYYDLAVGYSVSAVLVAAMIWISVSMTDHVASRILQWRPLVAIGTLSYSLYLWQQLFLNAHSGSWACHWPLSICLAFLAAVASYFLIETPFLRLKERTHRSPVGPEDRTGMENRPPSESREAVLASQ